MARRPLPKDPKREARRKIVEISEILNGYFKVPEKTRKELEDKIARLNKIAYE